MTEQGGRYTPVSCALYRALELAILRREALRLCWHSADGLTHLAVVQPRDLITREHAEFLRLAAPAAGEFELRLDCIIRAETVGP